LPDVFVFPASFAQQRLWFLDQFLPGNAFYNINSVVRLSQSVQLDVLRRSLGELVRRHESLRTTFAVVDEVPVQVIAAALEVPLETIDLRPLQAAERESETQRIAAQERMRPFDLTHGPLLRARVLRLGDDGDVLLLTLHHIISDGWSMRVLFRELSALYEAYRTNRSPGLAELTIQYADFAVWQRQWLRDEVLERQMAYWRTQLAGAPAWLNLPTDRPRAERLGFLLRDSGVRVDARAVEPRWDPFRSSDSGRGGERRSAVGSGDAVCGTCAAQGWRVRSVLFHTSGTAVAVLQILLALYCRTASVHRLRHDELYLRYGG